MSDIIKNPNRDRPRVIEERKPEYERLGVVPSSFVGRNYASIADLPINISKKIDNIKMDSQIIDNNEFLTFGALDPKDLDRAIDNGELIDLDEEIIEKPKLPNIGEYILLISGTIILSGPLKEIEEKVKNILYGEDLDFELTEVKQDEIIVLKRVELQVGVFIKD